MIQKGKVTVPQTINITVWPRLRRQVLQQQHSRWQALRPQQACLLSGVSEENPTLIKAKDPEIPLAVVGDLAALQVEDSQAGVFQEEEHQDQEPQEELQE